MPSNTTTIKIPDQVNFDATGKSIGRLASEVSMVLQGKRTTTYNKRILPSIRVTIANIHLLHIDEKKLKSYAIHRMSGYAGGLKTIYWSVQFKKNPAALFLKVLGNMLPKNKLRKDLLKKVNFI